MRKLICSAVGIVSLSTICSAQTITETFGTGSNAFSMDFVTIGNPGNAADTTGSPNPVGSVPYTYNLGKYEVSRDMITKASSAGSLGISLQNMSSYGGNGINRPATGVSWNEAAKFVNWLNTSKGYQAAYKFSGSTFQLWSPTDAGYNGNNLFRNNLAKYVIASTDEWYKAAYGNLDGTWNNYPTGSDSAPRAVASGTAANTAVYGQSAITDPADITSAGGLSPYGAMGLGGNVWEWNETAYDGINNTAGEDRELRGGSWGSGMSYNFYSSVWFISSEPLDASFRAIGDPAGESNGYGFRVVSVPEPSSLPLLALGAVVVALWRRRE